MIRRSYLYSGDLHKEWQEIGIVFAEPRRVLPGCLSAEGITEVEINVFYWIIIDLGWNCIISGSNSGNTNTMECYDADLTNQEMKNGGFSAHMTTSPVTVTFSPPSSWPSHLTTRAGPRPSSTLGSSTSGILGRTSTGWSTPWRTGTGLTPGWPTPATITGPISN